MNNAATQKTGKRYRYAVCLAAAFLVVCLSPAVSQNRSHDYNRISLRSTDSSCLAVSSRLNELNPDTPAQYRFYQEVCLSYVMNALTADEERKAIEETLWSFFFALPETVRGAYAPYWINVRREGDELYLDFTPPFPASHEQEVRPVTYRVVSAPAAETPGALRIGEKALVFVDQAEIRPREELKAMDEDQLYALSHAETLSARCRNHVAVYFAMLHRGFKEAGDLVKGDGAFFISLCDEVIPSILLAEEIITEEEQSRLRVFAFPMDESRISGQRGIKAYGREGRFPAQYEGDNAMAALSRLVGNFEQGVVIKVDGILFYIELKGSRFDPKTVETALQEKLGFIQTIATFKQNLRESVFLDYLTDMYNRSYARTVLRPKILSMLLRPNVHTVWVWFADVRFFKEFNVGGSYDQGDDVLRIITMTVRNCIGHYTTAMRTGGDEICFLKALSSDEVDDYDPDTTSFVVQAALIMMSHIPMRTTVDRTGLVPLTISGHPDVVSLLFETMVTDPDFLAFLQLRPELQQELTGIVEQTTHLSDTAAHISITDFVQAKGLDHRADDFWHCAAILRQALQHAEQSRQDIYQMMQDRKFAAINSVSAFNTTLCSYRDSGKVHGHRTKGTFLAMGSPRGITVEKSAKSFYQTHGPVERRALFKALAESSEYLAWADSIEAGYEALKLRHWDSTRPLTGTTSRHAVTRLAMKQKSMDMYLDRRARLVRRGDGIAADIPDGGEEELITFIDSLEQASAEAVALFPRIEAGEDAGLVHRAVVNRFAELAGQYGLIIHYGFRRDGLFIGRTPAGRNLSVTLEKGQPFTEQQNLYANLLSHQVYSILSSLQSMEVASQMAREDSMCFGSGIMDRNASLEAGARMIAEVASEQSSEPGYPLVITAMADVDNLKSYNDILGYAATDDLIRIIGRMLGKLGLLDLDIEYGRSMGDEFIIFAKVNSAEEHQRFIEALEVFRVAVPLATDYTPKIMERDPTQSIQLVGNTGQDVELPPPIESMALHPVLLQGIEEPAAQRAYKTALYQRAVSLARETREWIESSQRRDRRTGESRGQLQELVVVRDSMRKREFMEQVLRGTGWLHDDRKGWEDILAETERAVRGEIPWAEFKASLSRDGKYATLVDEMRFSIPMQAELRDLVLSLENELRAQQHAEATASPRKAMQQAMKIGELKDFLTINALTDDLLRQPGTTALIAAHLPPVHQLREDPRDGSLRRRDIILKKRLEHAGIVVEDSPEALSPENLPPEALPIMDEVNRKAAIVFTELVFQIKSILSLPLSEEPVNLLEIATDLWRLPERWYQPVRGMSISAAAFFLDRDAVAALHAEGMDDRTIAYRAFLASSTRADQQKKEEKGRVAIFMEPEDLMRSMLTDHHTRSILDGAEDEALATSAAYLYGAGAEGGITMLHTLLRRNSPVNLETVEHILIAAFRAMAAATDGTVPGASNEERILVIDLLNGIGNPELAFPVRVCLLRVLHRADLMKRLQTGLLERGWYWRSTQDTGVALIASLFYPVELSRTGLDTLIETALTSYLASVRGSFPAARHDDLARSRQALIQYLRETAGETVTREIEYFQALGEESLQTYDFLLQVLDLVDIAEETDDAILLRHLQAYFRAYFTALLREPRLDIQPAGFGHREYEALAAAL